MKNFIISLLILLALASAAHALGLGEGNRFGRMGSIRGKATAAPPIAGALLLEDGTSILLLEDNASQLCLEGGC